MTGHHDETARPPAPGQRAARKCDCGAGRKCASPGARGAGLKLFLGYAPGVGKTRALLEDGHHLRDLGVDVVVGFVDTRGRPDTAELLEGLEVLGAEHRARGAVRAGLDLDAALARRPQVLLLDDIERPNPAGSRHARSWQDLIELLDAGITVHATLDVFRLESLNDVVLQISGVRIEDTVPDSILERADEIVLVDVPPAELAARCATEATLPPILSSFNRERCLPCGSWPCAARPSAWTPTSVRFRREHGIGTWWPTSERVLACVGPSPSSARVVRAAMRVAQELHAPWAAASVSAPDAVPDAGGGPRAPAGPPSTGRISRR